MMRDYGFDQLVEYVTEGPIIHTVQAEQHSLETLDVLIAVAGGYRHAAQLGRSLLAGAELALVFSEWTAQDGLAIRDDVAASKILAPWSAKSVACGYVIASESTLDAINAARTTAVALIRMSLVDDTESLAPVTPFTAPQVTALATWLNAHGIANSEFAALFDVTAAQLSNWLMSHPRWQMAQKLLRDSHERGNVEAAGRDDRSANHGDYRAAGGEVERWHERG